MTYLYKTGEGMHFDYDIILPYIKDQMKESWMIRPFRVEGTREQKNQKRIVMECLVVMRRNYEYGKKPGYLREEFTLLSQLFLKYLIPIRA